MKDEKYGLYHEPVSGENFYLGTFHILECWYIRLVFVLVNSSGCDKTMDLNRFLVKKVRTTRV